MDKKVFIGWSGGIYDDAGLYDTKEDAERGMFPNEDTEYYTMFEEFDGKKVRITVEVIEE